MMARLFWNAVSGLLVAAACVCVPGASAGCATSTSTTTAGLPPLTTVTRVELPRYLGTWYEVASFPQSFQKGCTATTATYAIRERGVIDVSNKCRLGSLAGREKIAHGSARIPDASQPAKLEVSFFGPFWADYWIIDLGADYEYAVVGHPSRDYLWILSRTPTMPDATYDAIIQRLQAKGYDTSRLVKTLQSAE